MPTRDEFARLVQDTAAGQRAAAAELFPLVYRELRRLAAQALRTERRDHTLQPTALVHEAFLRLVGVEEPRLTDRHHFFALAARAMRRVLVDHARGRNAAKRGASDVHVPVDDIDVPTEPRGQVDFLVLDEALERLALLDARQARIVELRFFGGLTVEETALVTGASARTIKRDWQLARAWLKRELAQRA